MVRPKKHKGFEPIDASPEEVARVVLQLPPPKKLNYLGDQTKPPKRSAKARPRPN